ncbi:MAG: hypothetical protein KBG48_24505 [Kofleriaceae bacterium]|nr:hypothetical protein [Kofleriaceae bacterium]MBP9170587.1 hypothetical protein [Kofleriaceae bacterium]MBP9863061.1 hypothetical protein [Kofleriaceae bacterium]
MSDEAARWRFREEHAGVFALLWRRLGEFDLVDVALADAYLAATAAWGDGIPHNPATWMATVALSVTTGVVARRPEVAPASPQDDLRTLFASCSHPGLTDDQRALLLTRAAAGLMLFELAELWASPEAELRRRLEGAKLGLRKLGGRAAATTDELAARAAASAEVIAHIRRAPGAEAGAVADLLAGHHGRAFRTRE